MSNLKQIHFLYILLFSIFLNANAQVQLHPLSGNINLVRASKSNASNKKTTSVFTLDTLPFFDDFSYATKSPYPTHKHWLDSGVYVNNGFPIAPVSIGVATFDGLNKKGYPYNILAPLGSSLNADTLTSRQINIQKKGVFTYSPADSIYFSFYYQAEGRGDAPELLDELMLEFYKPNQKIWKKVWGKSGYNPSATDTSFKRVMLPVIDTAYFDSLFQFRFINKATLSGSLDNWHIDYVYLNKNRTKHDTIIEDVTFGYMSTPFLKNYSTMPFQQFVAGEMSTNIHTYIRNNSLNTKTKTYKFDIFPKTGGASLFNYTGGTNPITPFEPNGWHANPSDFNPTFSYTFPTLTDSTFFKIIHVVNAVPDNVKQNDTLVQIQKLTNYYAYDDGTAEQGYYLNTYGAKTAVRFTLNAADTIKALNIYFDPIVDGMAITGSPFRIMIWADGGSGPSSTIIYKDSVMYPEYIEGGYNLFPKYKLTSCLQLNAGTYYFGIQQSSNKGLNIGFDRNTNHMDALYYDIGSGWTQSAIPGSIMINPVLGCYEPPIVIGVRELEKNNVISIFPNPAQNTIYVKSNLTKLENAHVEIYNTMGQTILSERYVYNNDIDISLLPNGIYFVSIKGAEQTVSPKKLIISR
jgi:hypothetical protein